MAWFCCYGYAFRFGFELGGLVLVWLFHFPPLYSSLPLLTYNTSITIATPGAVGFSGFNAVQQASRASACNYSPRGVHALRLSTSVSNNPNDGGGGAFYVPELPYDYSALEPHLDTATM